MTKTKTPKDIKPSKELQDMRQEEVTAEPSLAGMLAGVDLEDPRLRAFFADLLAEARAAKTKE